MHCILLCGNMYLSDLHMNYNILERKSILILHYKAEADIALDMFGKVNA